MMRLTVRLSGTGGELNSRRASRLWGSARQKNGGAFSSSAGSVRHLTFADSCECYGLAISSDSSAWRAVWDGARSTCPPAPLCAAPPRAGLFLCETFRQFSGVTRQVTGPAPVAPCVTQIPRLAPPDNGGAFHSAIASRPASVICIQTTVLIRPLISTRLRCMTAYP
jgi:hypothetical protein